MAYSFDQIFAADPSNPENVAQNSAVTIFAPGDETMTPLEITDPDGQPIANPLTTNANGFASAFAHATLDRVAWAGGSFTGFFTSYEGMKQEAIDARAAAETAAGNAGNAAESAATAAAIAGAEAAAAAEAELAIRVASGEFKGDPGADGADGGNVLPTQEAIEAAIVAPGPAKTALDAGYVTTTGNTNIDGEKKFRGRVLMNRVGGNGFDYTGSVPMADAGGNVYRASASVDFTGTGTNGVRGDSIISDQANGTGTAYSTGHFIGVESGGGWKGRGSIHGYQFRGIIDAHPEGDVYGEMGGLISTVTSKRPGASTQGVEFQARAEALAPSRSAAMVGVMFEENATIPYWSRGAWLVSGGSQRAGEAVMVTGGGGWTYAFRYQNAGSQDLFKIDQNGALFIGFSQYKLYSTFGVGLTTDTTFTAPELKIGAGSHRLYHSTAGLKTDSTVVTPGVQSVGRSTFHQPPSGGSAGIASHRVDTSGNWVTGQLVAKSTTENAGISVFDWSNVDTGPGYLFHLVAGTNMGGGLIGLGADGLTGTALVVSCKSAMTGIGVTNTATSSGNAFTGGNFGTGTLMKLEKGNATAGTLLTLRGFSAGTNGLLKWRNAGDTVDHGWIEDGGQFNLAGVSGHHTRWDHGSGFDQRMYNYSGTPGLFFTTALVGTGNALQIKAGQSTAHAKGAEVLTTLIEAKSGARLGFYGATAVTRPILSYSRTGESTQEAAIRTALSSLGLVTDSTTA